MPGSASTGPTSPGPACPDRQLPGGDDPGAGPAAGRGQRLLDALAGLAAAGMLLVGGLLLLAEVLAPTVLPAAGLGAADGPGWSRVGAHLVVGVLGEWVVQRRRRWPRPVRVAAGLCVLGAAAAVIWWTWWR